MNIGHWCMEHRPLAAAMMLGGTFLILIGIMIKHKTKQHD